ncbi:MAG: Ribosome biogenesis protein Nop10 [Methanosaeta sp. PtaB.Bin018]|jgi:H/ACA ribonucleoprotein complex subunit 3|nr:RNA-protein complex protein Nop10 [Methanothrix sp.]OPX75835.1 MAG: Ribosome biogenesis protein Nop10 [Methanosaeta sp. PtaB.Bin018]OPY43310.1 MAG: Ribosome biogenesis protein Nop10 [Methanosaeta sp. PtaU1.Bin016]
MRSKIMRCTACYRYTLKDACPVCGASTIPTKPAKFSPDDPYGRYRRALAKEVK